MPVNPKGPPYKPGPSLRGRLIFDTLRGKPRVRSWPPPAPLKPGSRREWTANTFRSANRACKVMAEPFQSMHQEVTAGTPMLPRDLMIAFMYGRAFALVRDDGKIIYSMATRNEVSRSLDVLGSDPGVILKRGEKYWEAFSQSLFAPKAQIRRAIALGGFNPSAGAIVPYDTARYDTGPWFPPGSTAGVLTVPTNVTQAAFSAQFYLSSVTSNLTWNARINVNRSGVVTEEAFVWSVSAAGIAAANLSTPVVPVSPGDTDYAFIHISADASVTLNALNGWFAAEAAPEV